jgi:ribosomal subunit interface protein
MNINIQVRHEAAKETIQKYITTELEALRLHHEIISADCIVDQEGSNGHIKTFEAILHIPGDTFTVKERAGEVHKAVDIAMKVIEKLLTKHKETHLRPGTMIRHKVERLSDNS